MDCACTSEVHPPTQLFTNENIECLLPLPFSTTQPSLPPQLHIHSLPLPSIHSLPPPLLNPIQPPHHFFPLLSINFIPPNHNLQTPHPRPLPNNTILLILDIPKRPLLQTRFQLHQVRGQFRLVRPLADDGAAPGLAGWERVGVFGAGECH